MDTDCCALVRLILLFFSSRLDLPRLGSPTPYQNSVLLTLDNGTPSSLGQQAVQKPRSLTCPRLTLLCSTDSEVMMLNTLVPLFCRNVLQGFRSSMTSLCPFIALMPTCGSRGLCLATNCLQCKPFFTADTHDLVALPIIASVAAFYIADAYNRVDAIISSPCRHETAACL